ncbi:MAG TPA: 50S ribosomal protein L3 [Candidatus Coproplasma excrementavium]|nr:50S ribosomal protein L3 [Candidatus Coproplasma excrementavium]
MNKAIIGRKAGMTQVFTAEGKVIPVTVIEAGPCPVVQIKTVEKDGYAAMKLGFDETSEKNLNKPELGQFMKAGVKPCKVLKEFRLDDLSSYTVGSSVTADVFAEGDRVDVHGVTKGHGFSGVIKRWNQHRLKETHGVGPVHREPGSMGANSTPSRVFKNKNLPGHYGVENVTVQNLEVVRVDVARNCILIKGSVPGPEGSVVTINDTVK